MEKYKLINQLGKLAEKARNGEMDKVEGWTKRKQREVEAYVYNKTEDKYCHMPEETLINYAVLFNDLRIIVSTVDKAL